LNGRPWPPVFVSAGRLLRHGHPGEAKRVPGFQSASHNSFDESKFTEKQAATAARLA
jgi:hypothetical protein